MASTKTKTAIPRKTTRTAVLWARIGKENGAWITEQMKKLGYKSRSEFVDSLIVAQRNRKPIQDRA